MTITMKRSLLRLRGAQTSRYGWDSVWGARLYTTSLPRYVAQSRAATTSSSSGNRKAVTIASDDGRVRWTSLSRREKLARTTQQSFNFLTILTGVIMTVIPR